MDIGNQGRGWHGDSEGHAKAGRKGGLASSGSFQKGSNGAKEAGRKGGRVRDENTDDEMEQWDDDYI